MKNPCILILSALLLMSGCFNFDVEQPPDPLELFYDALSYDYPAGVTETLKNFRTNTEHGYRTAGSNAELAAADYLYNEMLNIGLKNVRKDYILVDSWEFSTALLTFEDGNGIVFNIPMASYPAQYEWDDEKMMLIYAGAGFEADYDELDPRGKLVLVETDKAGARRINGIAYQAKLKGARAVIVIEDYEDEDGQWIRNIRGSKDAPVFSIRGRDGDRLKRFLEDAEGGELSVSMSAAGKIEEDNAAYAVIGEIPGERDEVIYVTAHYDGFSPGTDDNASAAGAVLGLAKALTDSGYEPAKTIRFILAPAGEWGTSNSFYNWSTGAYRTVSKHPEWAEKAFALINIDGGGADGAVEIIAARELNTFAGHVGGVVDGDPFRNFDVLSPVTVRSGSFPYSQKGIPVLSSELADTDNYLFYDDVIVFALRLYGTLLIELDRSVLKPLDYTVVFEALNDAADTRDAPANAEPLLDAAFEAYGSSRELNRIIERSDIEPEDAEEFNLILHRISKSVQENLLSLTWEDELIFAHERYLRNVANIKAAIDALGREDAEKALWENLYHIDLNSYALYFDRETYDYFVDLVIGDDAVNMWGGGYIYDNADLYDVIQAIRTIWESEEPPDYREEIQVLEIELIRQDKLLRDAVSAMTREVITITRMIDRLTP